MGFTAWAEKSNKYCPGLRNNCTSTAVVQSASEDVYKGRSKTIRDTSDTSSDCKLVGLGNKTIIDCNI